MSTIRRVGGSPPQGSRPAVGGPAAPPTGDFREALSASSIPVASAATPAGPLALFRAGQTDRAGFVALHVEQATEHLAGLPAHDLESVRQALSDRCETEPLLADLVARATR